MSTARRPKASKASAGFELPAYAEGMIHLVTDVNVQLLTAAQFTAVEIGSTGAVRLVWGTPEGIVIAAWEGVKAGQPIAWDGRVHVGGFIERMHAREVGGLELAIIEIAGGLLPANHVALPSLADMRAGIFAHPSEQEPPAAQHTYPYIINAEANLAALAQDAMVAGIAVDAFGVLAPDAGGWHEMVGLPLLLDAITLLAP